MGASYDISTVTGFDNLRDGGTISGGVVENNYGYYKFEQIPDPIYITPWGVLDTRTVQLFIDNDALIGTYGGQTYAGEGLLYLMGASFSGGHYVKYGVRAWIDDTPHGHIYRLDMIAYDENDNIVQSYYNAGLPTAILEDNSKLFFWFGAWHNRGSSALLFNKVTIGFSYNRVYTTFDEMVDMFTSEQGMYANNSGSVLDLSFTTYTIGGQTSSIEESTHPRGSIPEGGDGDYDDDSDDIDFPTLPVISAMGSGLITMYNPTVAQLMGFSNYLWSNDVFTTLQKFIQSPMDLIISLAIVPVAVQTEATASTIKIGGISTGATALKVTNQYMTFDCGSITLNEYYGNALDYGDYTKLSIYLPYIGVRELKTDELMQGTIQVKYNIDLLTGACIALVKCTRQKLSSVLYSFEGNISAQLPIQAKDYMGLYTSIARGVVDTALTRGSNLIKDGVSSAISVMSSKPQINRSGSISANGGHLGLHTPYIIIERAIQSVPDNHSQFYGNPSNITATLGNLQGYTEVDYVIETNIHCLDEELAEINTLLKEGVYL